MKSLSFHNDFIHRSLFVLLLIVECQAATAQFYSVGTDPASIHWRSRVIGNYSLVYPDYYGQGADNMDRILRVIPQHVTASMQARVKSFPIVIHPEASYSNGFSILAPRRIELFPKHPASGEIGDLASQLMIHEFRHMAQMDRLDTGFTHLAAFALGEQAQAIVLGLHVPTWFLEGDAVLTETLLSEAGRGRIAAFSFPLRSKLISHDIPVWDRILLGSYKDYLPNEYLFGYYMAARGRMLSYPQLWSDNLEKLGKNPFQIAGFTRLLSKKTGLGKKSLYEETMTWLSNYWTQDEPTTDESTFQVFKQDSLNYYSYFKPFSSDGTSMICLKKSLSDLPVFVLIDKNGREEKLVRPGAIEDAGYSVCMGKIVWTEQNPTLRWQNQTASDLFIWEEKTGKTTRLTVNQRLFSPAFNRTGSLISCISEELTGESFLVVINPLDGKGIIRLTESRGDHFNYLGWGRDDNELVAVTTGSSGRKLIIFDLRNRTDRVILDAGHADIGHPVYINGFIYFTGPDGASQGVYRIEIETGKIDKVISNRFGINYLTGDEQRLCFSVYLPYGYRVGSFLMDSAAYLPVKAQLKFLEPVTSFITRATNEIPLDQAPNTVPVSESNPYRKGSHLFRLHSWAPLFVDPDSYMISPGAVLFSQNDLSTMVASAGYQYYKPQQSHNLITSVTYSGLFPIIEADYRREFRRDSLGDSIDGEEGPIRFYRQTARLKITVPLTFSSGIWVRRFTPAILFLSNLKSDAGNMAEPSVMAGVSGILSVYRKMSYRDLFPKWGAAASGTMLESLDSEEHGMNLSLRLLLYLPGGFRNSSFRILNSISHYDFQSYVDNPYGDSPRGLTLHDHREMYAFKGDYALPVAYPDWNLSWLLYVKRIRTNLFFDAAYFFSDREWRSSCGLDLVADYHLIRAGVQLQSGIRIFYFPQTKKPGAEFLYGFSL